MVAMEVATAVVTVDTVVVTEVAMAVDMVVTEVAMEDMDMARKRETLMPNQKLMLLLKPMPIMVMEAMEVDMADTVMVDTVDTATDAKGDQLNQATDTVAMVDAEDTVDTEGTVDTDMVVTEATVDTEAMAVTEATVDMDMVDMAIMVKSDMSLIRKSNICDALKPKRRVLFCIIKMYDIFIFIPHQCISVINHTHFNLIYRIQNKYPMHKSAIFISFLN